MNGELISTEAKGPISRKKPSQKLSLTDRQEKIVEVRDYLQEDDLSLRQLAVRLGCDHVTAAAYKKAALVLMAKDDQGFTREAIRHMQVGRIYSKVSKLSSQLGTANTLDDELKIHDRIIKYYDSLHRITGLNTDMVQIEHSIKPLQIVRSDVINIDNASTKVNNTDNTSSDTK